MKEEQEVENRKSKVEKIRMILPILWSSYEHMSESRRTETQNKINFLLIVVSFLPVLCVTLYIALNSRLFLIPTLFQLLALLNLLKSFFIVDRKLPMIPWLNVSLPSKASEDDTLKELEEDIFETRLFAALKAAEEDSGIYLKELKKIIKISLHLLIISIFLIGLVYIFVFLKGDDRLSPDLIVCCLYAGEGLLVLFLCLYSFYKNVPASQFKTKLDAFKNRIEEWTESKKG